MSSSITTEAQTLPELPVEIFLEVLEVLVASPDKASHRAAVHLSASCRSLRATEAGKQVRYLSACAAMSISAPAKMPANLEYETELLLNATWPLEAPAQPDPLTSELIVSACLRGSECFVLPIDRTHIHCYISEPQVLAAPGPSSTAAQVEKQVLRNTITLDARIAFFTVDEDANYCAVVYGDDDGKDGIDNTVLETPQSIEIRCLRTGELALPDEEARLDIDTSDGQRVTVVELMGDYLLLNIDEEIEVRRWRTKTSDSSPFPVVFRSPPPGDNELRSSAHFISPNLISHTTSCATSDAKYKDAVFIYSLGPASSNLLASFEFPKYEGDYLEHVVFACGAKIAAGEDGLCVVSASNSLVSTVIFTVKL